ncbi:MAG: CBO0543 family protein [Bacillota bacterium]|nr:CBO0543 family protein [Bacillota bacterium]
MGFFRLDLFNHLIMNTISLNQLIEMEKTFNSTLQNYWRENNFLSLQWWILVLLCIIPPIIWFKLVDKMRITDITLFGLFYGISAIILDSIGSFALVWFYPVRLFPFLYPQLYPYDTCILMIPNMLVYQRWGNNFKKFFLFTGLLSAFQAFLGEPLMEWLRIYKELTWKHIYSFPIYWILGIFCWLNITCFKKIEQRQ